jgi:hypothetical protein
MIEVGSETGIEMGENEFHHEKLSPKRETMAELIIAWLALSFGKFINKIVDLVIITWR